MPGDTPPPDPVFEVQIGKSYYHALQARIDRRRANPST
jgi:hypothetical protein